MKTTIPAQHNMTINSYELRLREIRHFSNHGYKINLTVDLKASTVIALAISCCFLLLPYPLMINCQKNIVCGGKPRCQIGPKMVRLASNGPNPILFFFKSDSVHFGSVS